MEENDKNSYRNEYGEDNYRINENHNLWNTKCDILGELESIIIYYIFSRDTVVNFNILLKQNIDKLELKNLSKESLFKLLHAVNTLLDFKIALKVDDC